MLIDLFTDDALASLDVKVVGKWRKYFQLKGDFYLAHVSITNMGGSGGPDNVFFFSYQRLSQRAVRTSLEKQLEKHIT